MLCTELRRANRLGKGTDMKAWMLHGINDLRFEAAEKPTLKEGEVLLAVKAAAVCGSDIPRIYKNGTYSYPLIPGHEFSGVIEEIGSGVEESWLGKRTGVFPLIPCGVCRPCQKRRYEMCRNYGYLGSRQNGAFAEYVAVPARNLIELPGDVSMEEAAMLEPMAVAVHAMRRIKPSAEETVAVLGLGTIGMLLVNFLREAGIRNILMIGNKEFQRQTVLKAGFPKDCYCDSRVADAEEWLLEHTEGLGADVVFECVGRNETFAQAVSMAAVEGRVCLVGNPLSDMTLERNDYWKILRNQITVTGTWNSAFTHEPEDDWHYILERLTQKKISPGELISHRLSMENLASGLEIMRDKTQDYIKIMMLNGGGGA